MLNLKKGQIIKSNAGGKYEVLEVFEKVCILESEFNEASMYSIKEIESNFILPKEKWVPKDGEIYYFVDEGIKIEDYYFDNNSPGDNLKLEAGNCFQTEAEAQKVVEEIKKILNK